LSSRENIRARLRIMVKRIIKKYKYPPDKQEYAIELVLQQAKVTGRAGHDGLKSQKILNILRTT
jgi:type I restriction enzyme R subunit